jgi:hypothetical protein
VSLVEYIGGVMVSMIASQLSLDSHLQRCYMQCFKREVLLVPSFIVHNYPVVEYTKVWEQVSEICSIHYDKLEVYKIAKWEITQLVNFLFLIKIQTS